MLLIDPMRLVKRRWRKGAVGEQQCAGKENKSGSAWEGLDDRTYARAQRLMQRL